MKIASSNPPLSALRLEMSNGLNHENCGVTECAGWLAYTLTRATTAKMTSVVNSIPSRNCCVRAESSIPT